MVFAVGAVDFPQELVAYGLSDELLARLIEEVLSRKMPLSWCLNVPPNVDFYQKLHPYLKKWHVTCKASKISIGKFYLAIDKFLLEKTDRPDNAYRFIDNLTKAKYTSSKPVDYGCRAVIERQFEECQKQLENMNIEVTELKGKLEESHHKMQSAHDALRAVTNEKSSLQSEKLIAERKAMKYREDNDMMQKDCKKLIEENLDLSATILDVRDELSKHDNEIPYDDCQATSNDCEFMASLPPHNHSCNASSFTIQTKQGRRYSPSIRKLYYTLLADEVPGKNVKVNHRLHTKAMPVHKKLFDVKDDDVSILYPMLAAGATKMKEKLCTHAQQQLPGGRYWSPDNSIIKKQLSTLKPSNDLCESILGLNDYLTTKIPNLNQQSISNLVEIKKNHSIMWLNSLDDTEQAKLINLATDLCQPVGREYRYHTQQVAQERQQRMVKAHVKQEAMKVKTQESDHLAKEHLVSTAKELQDLIYEIEESDISTSKKKAQKLSLLRRQVNIRKKVLGQKINIVFTRSGRQRSINDLEKELVEAIDQDSSTLIGRQISHRFKVGESEYKWYRGIVLEYDCMAKMHLVEYDDDEEPSLFDLNIDLLSGDLEILD